MQLVAFCSCGRAIGVTLVAIDPTGRGCDVFALSRGVLSAKLAIALVATGMVLGAATDARAADPTCHFVTYMAGGQAERAHVIVGNHANGKMRTLPYRTVKRLCGASYLRASITVNAKGADKASLCRIQVDGELVDRDRKRSGAATCYAPDNP